MAMAERRAAAVMRALFLWPERSALIEKKCP